MTRHHLKLMRDKEFFNGDARMVGWQSGKLLKNRFLGLYHLPRIITSGFKMLVRDFHF